ncbi:MAG: hypothetical protein WCG93_00390 [Paludibacter sp.]
MKKVKVNVEKTPNGYCANLDIIDGFVVAVTGSFVDLKREVIESIHFYIECAKKDKDKYPAVFDGEYELDYKFTVESLLHFYKKIIGFSALEMLTGINQRQLNHYASGVSKPLPRQAKKIEVAFHQLGKDLLSVSV